MATLDLLVTVYQSTTLMQLVARGVALKKFEALKGTAYVCMYRQGKTWLRCPMFSKLTQQQAPVSILAFCCCFAPQASSRQLRDPAVTADCQASISLMMVKQPVACSMQSCFPVVCKQLAER